MKKKQVHSLIYDYLKENKLEEYIYKYNLQPFEINVLSIERTLIDKIVSLVRMSYANDIEELKTKTRHLYDLHLTYPKLQEFYIDKHRLLHIIKLVREDEENSKFKEQYPHLEKWSNAPIWDIIKDGVLNESYKEKFGNAFVYGDLPLYKDIMLTLEKIRKHLIDVGE